MMQTLIMKHFLTFFWVVNLVALLAGCSQSSVQIVFPLDGATLQNPVTLEANQVVIWYANGERLGEGQRWQGQLASGRYKITAKGAAQSEIVVHVPEAFPVGKIRSFDGSLTSTVALSEGKYALIWGNTSNNTISVTPETDRALTALKVENETLDNQLRQRELELVRAGVKKIESPAPALSIQSLPYIGETRTFNMLNVTTLATDQLSATLYASNPRSLVYVENPETVDTVQLDKVIAAYEGHILERVTTFFGTFSDVDKNGKIILLFSQRLNDSRKAVGFFYGADLLERSEGNPASNEAEIIYLGIPEVDTLNFSIESLAATSCHETQHLINMARKTLPRLEDKNPPFETVAMNEGLSHLAEDLCGYNRLGGNLAFVARFLEHPHLISLTGTDLRGQTDNIERRGAAYLFLLFALEQAGGYHFSGKTLIDDGGIAFTKALIDSEKVGLENISQKLGKREDALLWQWWWALFNSAASELPSYEPRLVDPITGELQGVDIYAGVVSIAPNFTVTLAGPKTAPPQQLPGHSATFQNLSGTTTLILDANAEVQVLRLE
jgi:hypothetical protein